MYTDWKSKVANIVAYRAQNLKLEFRVQNKKSTEQSLESIWLCLRARRQCNEINPLCRHSLCVSFKTTNVFGTFLNGLSAIRVLLCWAGGSVKQMKYHSNSSFSLHIICTHLNFGRNKQRNLWAINVCTRTVCAKRILHRTGLKILRLLNSFVEIKNCCASFLMQNTKGE